MHSAFDWKSAFRSINCFVMCSMIRCHVLVLIRKKGRIIHPEPHEYFHRHQPLCSNAVYISRIFSATGCQSYLLVDSILPYFPILSANDGESRRVVILAASCWGLAGGTRKPLQPSSTTSGKPPVVVAITGRPNV